MSELLGLLEASAPPPVRFALNAILEAEKATAEASARYPERAELLGRAFPALCPRWELFGRLAPIAARAHVAELLERVALDGEAADLARGTSAEACAVLSVMSLRAPLRHAWVTAAGVAFLDAFGEEKALAIWGAEAVRRARADRGEHLVEEALEQLARAVRDEHRQKAWRESLARG